MATLAPNKMLQQHIMTTHAADSMPLLQRTSGSSSGCGSDMFSLFSLRMRPRGTSAAQFMPNFEFELRTICSFDLPGAMFAYPKGRTSCPSDTIPVTQDYLDAHRAGFLLGKDCLIACLRGADGTAVPVRFPCLSDLFHARNMALEGRLATLLRADRALETPVTDDMGKVSLGFSAAAHRYGFLEAKIALDHPNVETMTHELLETIERRSQDYASLQHYHAGGDPDDPAQPSGYLRLRKKLHKTMFREIDHVCRRHEEGGKLRYWHAKPSLLQPLIERIPLVHLIVAQAHLARYAAWQENEI